MSIPRHSSCHSHPVTVYDGFKLLELVIIGSESHMHLFAGTIASIGSFIIQIYLCLLLILSHFIDSSAGKCAIR